MKREVFLKEVDSEEATEKLYERHCLVIKIVSSFFAYLIKFLYL